MNSSITARAWPHQSKLFSPRSLSVLKSARRARFRNWNVARTNHSESSSKFVSHSTGTMSYLRPTNLDGFVPLLSRPDVRMRQQLGEDLLAFLGNINNDLCCEDMGHLVDGLLPWVNGGNFKVSFFLFCCYFCMWTFIWFNMVIYFWMLYISIFRFVFELTWFFLFYWGLLW